MTNHDVYEFIIFIVTLLILIPPLGSFMAKVLDGKKTFLDKIFKPIEKLIYACSGIDPYYQMNWKEYGKALIIFNFLGFLILFFLQMAQSHLPMNPESLPGVSWHLAFNTAVSFITNTNWQAYAGETVLSYLTQMLGLCVQNFLSAATGIAVFIALVRGLRTDIKNSPIHTLGNFWSDITRSTLYILLPLSIVLSIFLLNEGVIQNFHGYTTVTTLEGAEQKIPMGPAASQIAIKQIGSNGGGFFNANSAHPLENTTPFSNFLEMLALILLPGALVYSYGILVGSKRHGWIILGVMFFILLSIFVISFLSEQLINPIFHQSGLMEGKETRFGVMRSLLWATITTSTSNGAVNAMHSSLSPLAGGLCMLNMMFGEIIFGGVGSGMYGMILFIILTVFLAGLMVGRTPEYVGKKIGAFEMKRVIIGILIPSAVILIGASVTLILPQGLLGLSHQGPHGLSEVLYAFTSAAANNGSAFGGLNANTIYYNLMLGASMLIGRFLIIIPVLSLAGGLCTKKISPVTTGTFSTNTWTFMGLLICVILIVGALTFFPVLILGPIVEHFLMLQGQVF